MLLNHEFKYILINVKFNLDIYIERMKDKIVFYFKRKYAIILCRISMRTNRKEECYEIFI